VEGVLMGLYAIDVGKSRGILVFRAADTGADPLFRVRRLDAGVNPYANAGLTSGSDGGYTPSPTAGTGDVSGPGSATDNALARFSGTSGKAIKNGPVTCNDSGDLSGLRDISPRDVTASGDLIANVVGKGLRVRGGANSRIGVATLVSGTVVVVNSSVTANTRIFLSRETLGSSPGFLSYLINPGTNFTINSSDGADDGQIAWLLVEEL
jgi:hypothetical protein